jgi:PKD repeat protein
MKITYKLLVLSVFALFTSLSAYSQGVGIGTTSPDPSAKLEIKSNTQGTLVSRMTTSQRNAISNPANGLLIFNTTTNCFNVFMGSFWKQICGECEFNNPIPANNGPVCQGTQLKLSATAIDGASYNWTGPNGFTSSQQNPVISNVSPAASGDYSVSASKNGCTSSLQTTFVTVIAIPSVPVISGPVNQCANDTGITYTIHPVANADTYNWTVPVGASISFNSDTMIRVAFGTNSGNVSVSASNSCGSGGVASLNVTVYDFSAAFIPSSGVINASVVFAPADSGATYSWVFDLGTPATSNLQNPSVVWNAVGTYNVSLTVTSGACTASSSGTISINPLFQAFTPTGSGNTGNIQNFTVPSGVTSITIEAWGAEGGANTYANNPGGKGARMKGDFAVTPGEVLKILVGQKGGDSNDNCAGGGGGGGSFVTRSDNTPLLIAGGGGGASLASSVSSYMDGSSSNSGMDGTNNGGSNGRGIGGTNGNGSTSYYSTSGSGSGGGGLLSDGATGSDGPEGGKAFVNGGYGGAQNRGGAGGFGGGGTGRHTGAGGGGYSGGGCGGYTSSCQSCGGGGGGGSYNAGTNPSNADGVQSGDGSVIINY